MLSSENGILGYRAILDEESSSIEPVRDAESALPWDIAHRAVLEEIIGVQGDIAEGDICGRVEDDPDIADNLSAARAHIEGLARPSEIDLTDEQQKALDALIEDGETETFIELQEKRTPVLMQAWFNGQVPGDMVAASSAEEGLSYTSDMMDSLGYGAGPALRA